MQRRRFFSTKVTPKAKKTQQRRRLDDLGVSLLAAGHSHPGKKGNCSLPSRRRHMFPSAQFINPICWPQRRTSSRHVRSKTNKLLQRDSTCSTGTEARPGTLVWHETRAKPGGREQLSRASCSSLLICRRAIKIESDDAHLVSCANKSGFPANVEIVERTRRLAQMLKGCFRFYKRPWVQMFWAL